MKLWLFCEEIVCRSFMYWTYSYEKIEYMLFVYCLLRSHQLKKELFHSLLKHGYSKIYAELISDIVATYYWVRTKIIFKIKNRVLQLSTCEYFWIRTSSYVFVPSSVSIFVRRSSLASKGMIKILTVLLKKAVLELIVIVAIAWRFFWCLCNQNMTAIESLVFDCSYPQRYFSSHVRVVSFCLWLYAPFISISCPRIYKSLFKYALPFYPLISNIRWSFSLCLYLYHFQQSPKVSSFNQLLPKWSVFAEVANKLKMSFNKFCSFYRIHEIWS
jgi:hypothetical protein